MQDLGFQFTIETTFCGPGRPPAQLPARVSNNRTGVPASKVLLFAPAHRNVVADQCGRASNFCLVA